MNSDKKKNFNMKMECEPINEFKELLKSHPEIKVKKFNNNT